MAKTKKNTNFENTAYALVILGALNWGFIAISPKFNILSVIFGNLPAILILIYTLIGLSGLWMLWKLLK